MATDDDAPRTQGEDEPANESPVAIQAQRSAAIQTAVTDTEDFDTAEGIAVEAFTAMSSPPRSAPS